jgi:uncharacterized protein YcnI
MGSQSFTVITPIVTKHLMKPLSFAPRRAAALIVMGTLALTAYSDQIANVQAAPSAIAQQVNPNNNRLPRNLENRIRRDLARQTNIAPGQFRLVEATRMEWSDGCLGLGNLNEICAQGIVPGWRVVLSSGNRTWTYRTDTTGQNLRQEAQNSNVQLPESARKAVLEAASQLAQVPTSALRIIKAEQKTWGNACEFAFGEICPMNYNPVTGWEVTVARGDRRLVYRTDLTGTQVMLDRAASQLTGIALPQLPTAIGNAILQDAAKLTQFSASAFKIVDREQRTWPNDCQFRGGQVCGQVYQPVTGWRVTVDSPNHHFVYRASLDGSQVFQESGVSRFSSLAGNAVLQAASKLTNLPASAFTIVRADQKTWGNPCMFNFGEICTKEYNPVTGWEVTVTAREQRLVYRTTPDGSKVLLDRAASGIR